MKKEPQIGKYIDEEEKELVKAIERDEYVFGESDLSTSLPIDGIYMYMRQELLETWDGKLKTQNLI